MPSRLDTRAASGMVFVFFLCLYVLTLKGVSTGDEMMHYDLVQRILTTGRGDLPPGKYDPETKPGMTGFVARGRDHSVYLGLPHGLAVASLPLGAVGLAVDRLFNVQTDVDPLAQSSADDMRKAFAAFRRRPSALLTTAINPLVSALTVAMFFGLAAQLAGSLRDGLRMTLLLGLATAVWPYATNYWTQPIAGFFLLASLYVCWSAGNALTWRYAFCAGLLAGGAFLCRFDTLLLSVWLLLFCALRASGPWARRCAIAFHFSTGLASLLVLQAAWNVYRFGDWLQVGTAVQSWRLFRGDVISVLPLMVVSPYRGLLAYSPALILGLVGLTLLFKKDWRLAATIGGLSVTALVFFSAFGFWRSDATWGPRFLVPVTPFLLLPAALNVRRWAVGFWVFLAIGFAIQVPAVLAVHDPAALIDFHAPFRRDPWQHFWQWDAVAQSRSMLSGNIELWWLASPVRAGIGFFIACVGGIAGFRAARSCAPEAIDSPVLTS